MIKIRGHSGTGECPTKTGEIIKVCHVGQYPQDGGHSGEGGEWCCKNNGEREGGDAEMGT